MKRFCLVATGAMLVTPLFLFAPAAVAAPISRGKKGNTVSPADVVPSGKISTDWPVSRASVMSPRLCAASPLPRRMNKVPA